MLEILEASCNANVALAASSMTEAIVVGPAKLPHIPLVLHALATSAAMGVFGAARRNDGVEEHLEGHHRPHYQEHQGHHECSNQSFSVRVNSTRLIGLPVPLMSSPSCPLLLHELLLHPLPRHPPPLHLLLPSRVLFSTRTILALIVVLTLTSMSRGITNVRSYSFVRLCNSLNRCASPPLSG